MTRLVFTLLIGSSLTACASLGPVKTFEPEATQPPTVEEIPASFSETLPSTDYKPAQWWLGFEDPVLNELISRAQRQNFDIQEATARLAQANALARQAGAAGQPSLNATASSSFSDSPLAGSGFGGFGGGGSNRLQVETVSLSLGAAYELDLFARIANDTEAARRDAEATRFDIETLRLSAANETVRTYFEIVDTQEQIRLQQEIGDLIEERLALTEARFARGLAESFELYQLDQDLRSIRAGIPQRQSQLEQTITRLALILGEYSPTTKDTLNGVLSPKLSLHPVCATLPAELLDQRPDIRAAWERMEGSRLRVGARKAERYPNLSLSGSLGSQGADPLEAADILNNWVLSLATNIAAPILDGGRRDAAIEAAEATYMERQATYAETVVRAYGEVEAALADLRLQADRYELVNSQLSATRQSLETQTQRFQRGRGTYIAVLDAKRAVLQTEGALSSAGRDLALARLGVHRALGGDWQLTATATPASPLPSTPSTTP